MGWKASGGDTMSRIGVILPVLNGFQDALEALSRVKTKKNIWTPYIGKQWEKNEAISKVWNVQAIKAFQDGCDYCLIINDDSWLYPYTLDMLVDYVKETNLLLLSGTNSHEEAVRERTDTGNPAGLDFSCFLISPETFRKIGYFDENFYPAYFEDNDYHYRIKLLGLEAYGLADALFYHKENGSGTIHRMSLEQKEEQSKNFERCREYFIQKWGGIPDSEGLFTTPYNEGGSVREWKREIHNCV